MSPRTLRSLYLGLSALWVFGFLAPARIGHAASLTVTGAPGIPGGGGVPGGIGAPATAIVVGPDADNSATANGGGGGYGTPAGSGGAATALAETSVAGATNARAIANGGFGGQGITIFPSGDGGSADAETTALSSGGNASAFSWATAGAGGSSLTPDYGLPPGRTGTARASATSRAFGDASADTIADGSQALAESDALSETATAQAYASAIGTIGTNALLEPPDSAPVANATARSLGTGDAIARASANGIAQMSGVSPAQARAQAYSALGSATAEAIQIAGYALTPGPGASMEAHDLVNGSAHGLLTLLQTAAPSSADGPFDGGDGTSALEGENFGGGDLHLESTAYGGSGVHGGDAASTAVGRGWYPSAVEVRSLALGGNGSSGGGSADARATALGAHDLFAHAGAGVGFEATVHVQANAVLGGAIAGAHADLATPGLPSTTAFLAAQPALAADAGLGAAAQPAALPSGFGQGGTAQLFARPRDADTSQWLQGNPNALSAAGDGVLALGSLGGSAALQVNGATMELDGSASLDLTAASFAPDATVALALLDPTGSFDLLDLELTRDGAVLFSTSRTGSAADLDDFVVELGPVAAASGELSTYTLRWRLDVTQESDRPTSFALRFAFLGSAPVPEPAEAVLCALALFGLALRRRR